MLLAEGGGGVTSQGGVVDVCMLLAEGGGGGGGVTSQGGVVDVCMLLAEGGGGVLLASEG